MRDLYYNTLEEQRGIVKLSNLEQETPQRLNKLGSNLTVKFNPCWVVLQLKFTFEGRKSVGQVSTKSWVGIHTIS